MSKPLSAFRPAYVVGIGLHRYQHSSDTPYPVLGLTAVREALADARIAWDAVESVYHGTALLGMASTRVMLRHLGGTGIPMQQVENASASGSTAFRLAAYEVATGVSDVVLALGVDKPAARQLGGSQTGIRGIEGGRVAPFTHFALLAQRDMERHGATPEDFARVAVKNHGNGAHNPYAQRQQARSLADVLNDPPISGALTRLQCCPVGEGAAAVIVASEDAIARLGIDRTRCVQVLSSAQRTEVVYGESSNFDAELTRETTELALAHAGIAPRDLDLIELHDAFSVEEIFYLEAMGIANPGEAPRMLREGAFDIGGDVAVSPSGGLLAMGHPIGPTGAGQIVELTRQLRGEAGARQHMGAKLGLAHMVGVGAVCVVHVLGNLD
jgi:acetyl-CoA acetyltransferase